MPAIFHDAMDTLPMTEGDTAHCARALLSLLPADELAAVIRPYAPAVPPRGHDLRRPFRTEQLQRAREERGLKRLKAFDPTAPAPVVTDLAVFPAVGELLDFGPAAVDDVWPMGDRIDLGPVTPGPDAWGDDPDDDDRDDDGDTVPEPTPLVPFGAAAEPVVAG